ncbi:hypothetical protein Nizo2259_2940 [Lactiplantibacillus plantarum]|uniref:Uncharacterized protein n=2 Tax=Lactiplantibacillus plantarum TaxID=1590 RepID=A0A166HA08_LACPN|nr:hypothetical protein LPST_C1104 [Lactiplantibacillus plantarum ST-III]ALC08351.1 hypothetical protein JM48_1143 [Lactiplantibacillus plantarum]KPN41303.1 hypothetical protein WJL_2671 [Lactiplantibacillus plantarum WJL]KEZ14311.1 hypothetical protein Lp90_1207 [Lactiplantibacillus plantarum]KFL92286.1 hypothetical protein LpDm1_0061 [Lactiplantibacillus plantarum]
MGAAFQPYSPAQVVEIRQRLLAKTSGCSHYVSYLPGSK